MHEYALVQSLLAQVERHVAAHPGAQVLRIRLRVGELSGVEVPLLRTAYETFRDHTPCARAALELVPVPASWRCPGCGRARARGELLQCPDCSLPARLEQGDEILLERIEMEVP